MIICIIGIIVYKSYQDTEKSAVGFQPFSPNHSSETEDETRPEVNASMTVNLYI